MRVNSNYGCFMNSLIVVHELTSLTIHHMADYSLLIGNPVATFLLICGNNLVSSWQYIPKRPSVFQSVSKGLVSQEEVKEVHLFGFVFILQHLPERVESANSSPGNGL